MDDTISPLIDSHCHLEKFVREGSLDAVLERARIAGVGRYIVVGTDRDDWALYQGLAKDYPGKIHYTVGLHPCHVGSDWAARVGELEGFFRSEMLPVAIGEIGLDYFHLPKDAEHAAVLKAQQQLAFEEQLKLASALDARVIIHSRGAFDACVATIDASGMDWSRVVFHCFVEDATAAKVILSRGGWASFTGVVTYKKADAVREAAREVGLERIMIETDCPYLTPEPKRSVPNEPAYLAYTAQYLAELLGVGLDAFRAHAYETTCRVYGLIP